MKFLLIVHVLIAIALIGLILIQHGKGADAGAAFGSGASSTVFGARGSASFLSRATAILATLFFAISLMLYIIASRDAKTARAPTTGAPEAAKNARPGVKAPTTGTKATDRPKISAPAAKDKGKDKDKAPAKPAK